MFANLQKPIADKIFTLVSEYQDDLSPEKMNLVIGVFNDEDGKVPLLNSVHQAEQKILSLKNNKNYLPILGDSNYISAVTKLVFGEQHKYVVNEDLIVAQTPGGTGALRLAGDLIFAANPTATVWLSNPTWANHPNIFNASGLKIKNYAYYDASKHNLDFDAMLQDLSQAKAGDVVLLHGCCHNPTGVDLSVEQWERVGKLACEKDLIVLIDFAYQGFAEGVNEDRVGIEVISSMPLNLMVASSCSKNFGLYNQRLGSLSVYIKDESARPLVKAKMTACIRTNYSNPPAHGANIVATILNDHRLYSLWLDELKQMRDNLKHIRTKFDEVFAQRGLSDYAYLESQNGMFSLLPLLKDQIQVLKDKYHVYMVGSGRINVCALIGDRIDILADIMKNKLS